VQEKPKGRRRTNAGADYEAPNGFYRAEEGGEMVPWRRNGRRRVEQKGACEASLGSRVEGQLEDVAMRRCVTAVGSRSQAVFGLTRGGR
jgi:hypothetical protein